MFERLARTRRWLLAALFGGSLGAAGWRIPTPPPPELLPVPARQLAAEDLPAAARNSPERPSLTHLADGRPAVAWLDDGDRETAAIRLAIGDGKGWREIGRIASRESTAAATFMHAQNLGRPLLWAEGGWLHLWYEAYPLSRNAGASIIHSVSTDGGRNWSRTQRLETSSFGGTGTTLGEVPRPLADGGLLLPLGRDDAWLRLAATGQIVGKQSQLPPTPPTEPTRP